MTESIRWDATDGIVTLTLDDPGKSANTINDRYVASMGQTLDRLLATDGQIIYFRSASDAIRSERIGLL